MKNLFKSLWGEKEQQSFRHTHIKYSNDDEYQGDLMNDMRHGQGTYKFSNGNRYEGQWKNHMKHGQGKYYYNNGELYIGQWEENRKQGQGMHFYLNGDRYVGQWNQHMRDGKGTIYQFDHNIFTGISYDNIGIFQKNKKQGLGYFYNAREKKYYEQIHEEDVLIENNEIPAPPKDVKHVFHTQYARKPTQVSVTTVEEPSPIVIEQNKSSSNPCESDNHGDKQEFQQNSFQQNSQIGFETLQVMENIEQIQKNESARKMQDWQVEDVCAWLSQLLIPQYIEAFKNNQVTGNNLFNLTDNDLKEELGVQILGHRKTILQQIELYKQYYLKLMQNKLKRKSMDPMTSGQFNSIDNQKYNKLFSYMEKIDEEQQEDLQDKIQSNLSLDSDNQKKKRHSSEERKRKRHSSSSDGAKKRKKKHSSSSSDGKKKKKRNNRDSSNSSEGERRKKNRKMTEDDDLNQEPKIRKQKSKRPKKRKTEQDADSADDEYNGENNSNTASPNRIHPQGVQGLPDNRKASQDSHLTGGITEEQHPLDAIQENLQSNQGASITPPRLHYLEPNVDPLYLETEEQQTLLRTPILEKKSLSEPLKISEPLKQSESYSSVESDVSSNSSISSSSSDSQQRQKRKPKNISKLACTKIKQFNMSTFMSMLEEFGINENVLIKYQELAFGPKIGEGGYGDVYKGKWLGQDVAIKSYGKRKRSTGKLRYRLQMADFLKEVEVISNLRHPNIVLYMGVCQKKLNYYLITEYLEQGSLFDHLHKKQTKFDFKNIIKIVEDIALGMNYLHGRKVLHCDLKSSNVLIDQNWNVKLCDFGLSRMKKKMDKKIQGRRIGTPHWMAPEIMRGEAYQEQADVYSFGMILWEMITCKVPYDKLSVTQIIGSVGYDNGQVEIPETSEHSTILELVKQCLNKDPSQRPNFNQIVRIIQAGQQGEQQMKKQAIQQLLEFFE